MSLLIWLTFVLIVQGLAWYALRALHRIKEPPPPGMHFTPSGVTFIGPGGLIRFRHGGVVPSRLARPGQVPAVIPGRPNVPAMRHPLLWRLATALHPYSRRSLARSGHLPPRNPGVHTAGGHCQCGLCTARQVVQDANNNARGPGIELHTPPPRSAWLWTRLLPRNGYHASVDKDGTVQ